MLMALLLDAANIIGGLLLAIPLLGRFPVIARVTARIAPWRWLVGIIALVAGGYYLIVHLVSGPHVFHFEVVGIAVGVILAWDRLTGRRPLAPAVASPAPGSGTHEGGHRATEPASSWPAGAQQAPADLSGAALVIAVFGIIAIVVGIQGLFTPN